MREYRVAAWTLPSAATFEPVDGQVPALPGTQFDRTDDRRGRMVLVLPADYDWQAIHYSHPTDRTQSKASLVRVYAAGDDHTAAPLLEYRTERVTTTVDADTGERTVNVFGRAWRVAGLDEATVYPYDWTDGGTVTRFGDWEFGGDDLVANPGFNDTALNETVDVWNDATGGTFTLTVTNTQGTDTTAAIAWNASAATVQADVEALSNVAGAFVSGAGTAADPWRIEFTSPGGEDYPAITPTDSLTGGTTTISVVVDGGAGDPNPWTVSQNPQSGSASSGQHGTVDVFRAVTTADPGWSYNGGAAAYVDPGAQFGGIQQVIDVTPGATLQASIDIGPTNAATLFRFVLRDINERLIGSSTPFAGVSGPAGAYFTAAIADVQVPADLPLGKLIVRVASVSTGDPDPYYVRATPGVPIIQQGLGSATVGAIVEQLLDDAQTDHTPTRLGWLTRGAWSAAVDSAAVAWPRSEAVRISRGRTYGSQVLGGVLASLGYTYDIVPAAASWTLEVWAPGNRGTDHTAGDTGPAFVWGAGVAGGPYAARAPRGTRVMAEGDGGLLAVAVDADLETAYGTPHDRYVRDTNIRDAATLTAWAQQTLDDDLANLIAVTVTLDGSAPAPLVDFDVGDTANFLLPGLAARHPRHISTVQLVYDGAAGWVETVTASRLFVGDAALAEAVWELMARFDDLEAAGPAASNAVLDQTGTPAGRPIIVAGAATGPDVKAAASYVCDGVDDDIEIAAALAAAMAEQSRVVYLAGTFTVGATVVVPAFGSLRGLASSDGSIVFGTSGLSHVIELSTRADLRDVQVSPAGNGDSVRYTLFSSWQRIIRCHLKGAGTGAALRAPNGVNRAQLLDSRLENATLSDPLIVLAENVQDWTMDGCRLDGGSYGVDVTPGASAPGRIVIHRNRFVGCGYGGIRIAGNGAPYVQIIDNHLTGLGDESAGATVDAAIKLTGTAAADWEAASTEEYGTIVRGNIIEAVTVGHGIILEDVDGAIVDGNYIEDTNRHGIWLDGATEATVIGNVLWSNGVETPSGTYDHMRVTGGGRHRLVANRARIRAGGSVHAGYGLHVEAGAVDVYVDDSNDFADGGTTGDVLIAGTATGLTAAGTGSIADTASSVSVTHGLPYTPTAVVVTPDGDERLWVTAIGATTFDVVRAGTSGVRGFSWAAR